MYMNSIHCTTDLLGTDGDAQQCSPFDDEDNDDDDRDQNEETDEHSTDDLN